MTVFKPTTQEECMNEYTKSCYIDYGKTAVNVDVEICKERLERNCNFKGDEVCSVEHETSKSQDSWREYDYIL